MSFSAKVTPLIKISALLVAGAAFFSILCQFIITDLGTVSFLSYFTTLCNLLVAVSLGFAMIAPSSKPGIFFSKLSVQSAIALYIFIVSIVYNAVLRGIRVLTGWEYFLDNMVHVVNPILYIGYWIFFRSKGRLQWKDGIIWILFPFLYLVYSLIRGEMIKWYPYPFLNAEKFGYPQVSLNIAVMLGVFLAAGLILITITRLLKPASDKASQ